jgi:hypothetical protein
MKFVKQNLVPLICGVVVLLFIGAMFWPLGSWQSELQAKMGERYGQVAQAKNLITTVTIPGGVTLNNATYEQNVINAGVKSVDDMHKQNTDLIASAAEQNRQGRILMSGNTEVPELGKTPEPNYLPVMTSGFLANPQRFKTQYNAMFRSWNFQLVGKDIAAVPPSATDITNAYTAEQQAKAKPLNGNPLFTGGGQSGAPDAAETLSYERNALSRRAGEIHMYVDPIALQRRDWWSTSAPPNESQIFEALVDSWFQQDVVGAITEINKGSANVGTSPIKRLEFIRVGVTGPGTQGSAPTGGPLFFAANSSSAAPGAVPAPAGPDYSRTMTGRTDNDQYDTVLMDIIVDLDPAYQNKFIDALYRKNNGYTVLNIRTTTVDPFDAASTGYLYGNTQVVHLDILVEGLLFRSWTLPIMPNAYRAMLGLPPYTPPGAPGT